MIALALGLALAAPDLGGVEVPVGDRVSCVGEWAGGAVDTWPDGGRSDPYGVQLSIRAETGSCGTIEYSLGCGGTLERCAVDASGHFTAVESYTHNPGTCAPAGRVDADCSVAMLAWRWSDLSGVQTSAGTLRRVEPAPALPAVPVQPRAACGCASAGGGGWLGLLAALAIRRPGARRARRR